MPLYPISTFRYNIDQPSGGLTIVTSLPTGWVHAVLIYHGEVEGTTLYHDKAKVGSQTSLFAQPMNKGTGIVFIGRRIDWSRSLYSSVYVDELKMYNRQLSQDDISRMYWYK